MSEAVEVEDNGIDFDAHVAWREWVDTMHGENPKIPVSAKAVDEFTKVWYPVTGSADSIKEARIYLKNLVQRAFTAGYHEGFVSRIFKGESK